MKELIKKGYRYFSKGELLLWFSSLALILTTFFVFDKTNYLTLSASLIGVTSLIFNAKGNPFGQVLMISFSIIYGIISFSFSYYGEMITNLRLHKLVKNEKASKRSKRLTEYKMGGKIRGN